MNNLLLLVLLTAAAIYIATLWRADLRAAAAGQPVPRPLPGATPASGFAVLVAVAGAGVLLLGETAGELALGIAGEQSRMTWLFALYSVVAAPIVEELVFRGWLVVENRGRAALWGAAVGASALFAALHPFVWRWDESGLAFVPSLKGAFSTGVVFATSLWFYVARFAPWNRGRSLLPCVAAHAAKNLGVVAIKAATGFMGTVW